MIGFVCFVEGGIGVYADCEQAHSACVLGVIAKGDVSAHCHSIPLGGLVFTPRDRSYRDLAAMLREE